MNLPFTQQQFLGVFARYNETYFPLQIVFYLLALLVIVSILRNASYASRLTNAALAFFWIWMGAAYHWAMFSAINPAAWIFGGVFLAQGVLFAVAAAKPAQAEYRHGSGWMVALGWVFVVYALIAYPVIGYFAGMRYPELISLGLPCPTTIFTFGLLMWTARGFRKWLAVIPFVWAVVGTSAAFTLGVYQDFGLGAAGLLGALALWMRKALPK